MPGKKLRLKAQNNTFLTTTKKQLRYIIAAVFVFAFGTGLELHAQDEMLQMQSYRANPAIERMNREISLAVVQEITNSDSMSRSRMLDLLQTALEYYPENSDALYLSAVMHRRAGDLRLARQELRQALEFDNWFQVLKAQAASAEIQLLTSIRQYGEIADRYYRADGNIEFFNSPDMMLQITSALYNSGRTVEAQALLERLRNRYPEDLRFRAMQITWRRPPLIGDYRWLLNSYERLAGSDDAQGYLPVLYDAMLHYLFTMEGGDSRRQLLAVYMENEDADVLSELVYLEELDYNLRTSYLQEMGQMRLLDDYILLSALRELNLEERGASDEFFSSQFAEFPYVFIDADRDGKAEIEMQYRDQMLHWVRGDQDQDNIWEWEILFHEDDGGATVPYALILRQGRQSLEVVYSRYPDVHHATLNQSDATTNKEISYYLSSEQFSLPVIQYRNSEYSQNFRQIIPELLSGQRGSESLLLYSQPAAGIGFNLMQLPDIQALVEDFTPYMYLVESSLNQSASMRESSQIRFEDQQIVASRYDFDGDGVYELLDYYENGALRYRMRQNMGDDIYLALYDEGHNLVEEILLPIYRTSELPAVLQPGANDQLWSMPE